MFVFCLWVGIAGVPHTSGFRRKVDWGASVCRKSAADVIFRVLRFRTRAAVVVQRMYVRIKNTWRKSQSEDVSRVDQAVNINRYLLLRSDIAFPPDSPIGKGDGRVRWVWLMTDWLQSSRRFSNRQSTSINIFLFFGLCYWFSSWIDRGAVTQVWRPTDELDRSWNASIVRSTSINIIDFLTDDIGFLRSKGSHASTMGDGWTSQEVECFDRSINTNRRH